MPSGSAAGAASRDLPLVYITRHGQTDWNAEARLQGQRDIPLNETGRAQARANGRALADLVGTGAAWEGFDFVASPLGRARETMEIVRGELGLNPSDYQTDDRLKEMSFGDWEGYTFEEMERASGEAIETFRERDKWNFRPPGERAESYAMLAERIAPWLDELRQPTLAIIHGGVVRSLFRLVGGLSEDEAAHAPDPQDRVLRMSGGKIGWL